MSISITQNKRYLIIVDSQSIDACINIVKPFEVFKNGTNLIIKNDFENKKIAYADVVIPGSLNIDDLISQLIDYNNNDHITWALDNITIDANVVNVSTVGVEERLGNKDEAPAATDTSTSGLNGLIKRLLQRFTLLLSGQDDTNGHLIDVINELTITSNEAHGSLAVTNASQLLVALNNSRRELIMLNDTNKRISVCLFTPAVFNQGIIIEPKQSFILDTSARAVYVIGDTGVIGNLIWQEVNE